MTPVSSPASRWLKCAAVSVVLLAMAGCAPLPSVATVGFSPRPAQQARIWFYRDAEIYDSFGRPYIRLNGAIAGIAEQGGAFYRDVPPGHYRITVDSLGSDVYQSTDVDLAAGQETYTKIAATVVAYGGGRKGGADRVTFYAWLMPNDVGRAAVWAKPFYGGGQVAAVPPQ